MILDKFKGNDEAAKLARDIDVLQRQIADDEIAANAIENKIADATAKLESAAIENDRKAYDKIAREIESDRTEQKIILIRAQGRRKKLSETKSALYAARSEHRVRRAADYGRKRAKYAASIVEHVEGLYKAYAGLHESGREISEEFSELATNHRGCLVGVNEIIAAIETELARVSSPGALASASTTPSLPGSAQFTMGGNPAKAAPITDVIAQANGLLVKRLSAQFLPEPAQPKPAPAAQPDVDADDEILNPPPAAPVSAEQVMATLGRRKMA